MSQESQPFGAEEIDRAPDGFLALERRLSRRTARTTRSVEDFNSVRALVDAWFRVYRPQITRVLGEYPAISTVDERLQALRANVGTRFVISDLRAELRAIARHITREILPAYAAARWSGAATAERVVSATDEELLRRLEGVSLELAESYRQVLQDTRDESRLTFLGPAGELREIMRAAIHILAPDNAVAGQAWFVGHQGRPTQAERIRFILQEGRGERSAVETAEVVEQKVAELGRSLYTRASQAFHAGAKRAEVERALAYVRAILNEILPA
jgi:hypothetical protein